MGNTGGKALPYSPGERIPTRFSTGGWQIFDGHSTADKSVRVTIFKFDKVDPQTKAPARSQHVALAQNALKRLKTLRHPHVLKLLDSLETEEAIMMVCEQAIPLSRWLEMNHPDRAGSRRGDDDDRDPAAAKKDYETSMVWGLFCLAEALAFLNSTHLLHGNLSPDAVFVTKGDSWKLGAFDMTCPLNSAAGDAPDPFLKELDSSGPCPDLYRSPERAAHEWGSVAISRSSACLDAFSLGTLLCEAFSGQRGGLQNHEQVKEVVTAPRVLPLALKSLVQKCLSPNPKLRPIDFAAQLRSSDYFRHPLVGCMVFLDELALKEPAEKHRFFRSLPQMLSDGSIPDHIAKYRLLPALMQALEFGAAGGGGTIVLAPILEIGSRLPPAEYEREIIPCVVRLFASTDRATRVQLLHHLPSYIGRLSDALINESILPQLLNGFADTNAVLREATVKSALHLASRLTEQNRYNVLLKQLKKTAVDNEPAIRVNTIICIGRLAYTVHDAAQREDLLVSVFLRAMRDPFPASRAAALKAIAYCVSLPVTPSPRDPQQQVAQGPAGYWSAELLAKKALPAASYLTLDPYGDARDAAFTLVDSTVKILRSNSDAMWVEEIKKATEGAPAAGSAAAPGADSPAGSEDSSSGISSKASSYAGKAMAGALGWAVSSLASRIIPSGTIDGQEPTPAPAPVPAQASSAAGAGAYPSAGSSASVRPSQSSSSLSSAGAAPASASSTSSMKLSSSASSGAISSSSRGGAAAGGGGWGDFDDLGLDDDDDNKAPTRPSAAAARPSGLAAAPVKSAPAAGVTSTAPTPVARKQPTLAEAARASAVAKSAAASSDASGWGDDAWGSLLGDSAPAPAKAAAPARPAPSAVAAPAAAAASTAPAAQAGGMKLAAPAKKLTASSGDGWEDW